MWRIVTFEHDSQPIVASVSSDGACRAAVMSCIAFRKAFAPMVQEIVRIDSVAANEAGASNAMCISECPSRVDLNDEYDGFADSNALCALHALDYVALAPNNVLLACGGPSGTVHVKMFDPRSLIV